MGYEDTAFVSVHNQGNHIVIGVIVRSHSGTVFDQFQQLDATFSRSSKIVSKSLWVSLGALPTISTSSATNTYAEENEAVIT